MSKLQRADSLPDEKAPNRTSADEVLVEAARNGDTTAVRAELEKRSPDTDSKTVAFEAVHEACRGNHDECLALLLPYVETTQMGFGILLNECVHAGHTHTACTGVLLKHWKAVCSNVVPHGQEDMEKRPCPAGAAHFGGYYGGVGQDGVPEVYYEADPQGYSGPQEDSRPFQGTPYKSILPKSPEDMIRHPITFLPMIQLPRTTPFRGLDRAVLHMFQFVKKLEKNGSGPNRVLLVTDSGVYRCTSKGIVNRCNPIADIKTIYQNNNNELGLQMRNRDKDYDMMYQFPNRETMENCIRIILQIQSRMKDGVIAKLLEENHIRPHLQFKRPQGYEFRLHAATPIDRLYEKTKILDDEQRRRHDAAQVAERQRHERK